MADAQLPPRHGGYRASPAANGAYRSVAQPKAKAIKPPRGKGGGSPERAK